MVVILLFDLSLGPHLCKTHGMGVNATEMNANTLVAQSTPNLLYTYERAHNTLVLLLCKKKDRRFARSQNSLGLMKSGNAAARAYRRMETAATAEAPMRAS